MELAAARLQGDVRSWTLAHLIAAALPVLAALAPSWSWFAILVACRSSWGRCRSTSSAPPSSTSWVASGRLLLRRHGLAGRIRAAGHVPACRPIVLTGYFVVVVLATLASDRFKTLLGTIALGGMLVGHGRLRRASSVSALDRTLPAVAWSGGAALRLPGGASCNARRRRQSSNPVSLAG